MNKKTQQDDDATDKLLLFFLKTICTVLCL